MSFFSRLEARVRAIDSLLCVGLDPHPADLPEQTAQAAGEACIRLVQQTTDFAAAYKPNIAFFEAFGALGIQALERLLAAIPDEIPVILDAKRGDIASTAEAYVRAVFETLDVDAVTVNPYLGVDAVAPFIKDPERGVFLLCKTSNPGAADLQDLHVSGEGVAGLYLYERVAALAKVWNRQDNLGLVVGATYPQALAAVRAQAPDVWILAPGVGAQGGDLGDALGAGTRSDGLGLLVPVSRGISRAEDPRRAAQELRDQINAQLINLARKRTAARGALSPKLARLADALLNADCVKFGIFTLKSGLESPIYIDLRRLAGYPSLLRQVAEVYLPLLANLAHDRLAALPYAALPIGTAVSLLANKPMIYPRKESKAYGTRADIEGVYHPGERVVILDDLATTGGSKFEAVDKLAEVGLFVSDVVVLIDRQSGASEGLAERDCRLHAVLTLDTLLDYWEASGKVPADQLHAARVFLAETGVK